MGQSLGELGVNPVVFVLNNIMIICARLFEGLDEMADPLLEHCAVHPGHDARLTREWSNFRHWRDSCLLVIVCEQIVRSQIDEVQFFALSHQRVNDVRLRSFKHQLSDFLINPLGLL